jgi:SAM-dependent methyltransferase
MLKENRYQEYDTWAWLYNQTMGPEYSQTQLQPLEKLLLPKIPKNAQILDLCCGTGHLVQLLSQKGHQMTGIDGSDAMLAYAYQNASQAQFILDDARTFALPSQFDAVFSTSASLNHIMSIEELKQVFQQVYDCLNENGLFLFDLNHSSQMTKWWKGNIVEGEIESDYAWFLIPCYNPQDNTGYFKITLFQSPNRQTSFLKRLLYKLLSLRRLTRFRFKILSQFSQWEKTWQCSEMTYDVKGYPNSAVQSALESVGFTEIEICTLEGKSLVDDNHSAYFICHKKRQ